MSDEFIVGYLQAMVGLLVFGLGVPAYVFQVVIPDEIKKVVTKSRVVGGWGVLLLAGFYCVAMAYFVCISRYPSLYVACPWVSHGFVLVAIGATVIFWWHQTRISVISVILAKFVKNTERAIDWYASVPSEAVEDLVSIGRAADGRRERIIIMNALGRIINVAQSRSGYRGNSLEAVIEGLEVIAMSSSGDGTDDGSMLQASDILRKIIERAEVLGLRGSSDIKWSIGALRRVAVAALQHKSETAGFLIAGRMADVDEYEGFFGVYEVGRIALGSCKFLAATKALIFLEARVLAEGLGKSIASHSYLGLIAHWYVRDGECRRMALSSLGRMGVRERGGVKEAIDVAVIFFGDRLELGAIDNLFTLAKLYRIESLNIYPFGGSRR